MSRIYELVIFDLDGTLIDTSPGIFNSVRFTEKQMGFTPIEDSRLREFVGPPPKVMYMEIYGLDGETAFIAAQNHRDYGRTMGLYEASVYSGIFDTLGKLKSDGYKLAVSTLKSQKIAESILGNFGLCDYFDVIVGMDDNETYTKCLTIQNAMRLTKTRGKVLMVGDSKYDYDGSLEAGIDFIGVLYGFGFYDNIPYPFVGIKEPLELIKLL